jgi:methylated-DNA-[protein]-cysteine S-methyltransferase
MRVERKIPHLRGGSRGLEAATVHWCLPALRYYPRGLTSQTVLSARLMGMNKAIESQLKAAGPATFDERLVKRLADRAGRRGLLDVAVASVDSPIGELLVAGTEEGLVRVAFDNQDFDAVMTELADRVSPRILEAPNRLDTVRRELDQYFEGRRTEFDVPVDFQLAHGFRRKALGFIATIPYGRTASYREVAGGAGNPNAVRAAGSACATNPIPIVVPCHRVLRTGGALGGYGGGLERKERLLRLEGSIL